MSAQEVKPASKKGKSGTPKKTTAASTEAAPVENKPYAIIRTGGKQYRVTAGSRVTVMKLAEDVGAGVTFDDVLMTGVSGEAGAKVATGAKVTGKVVAHKKSKKVLIFKKRRRGGYTKKQGHRQEMTVVAVDSVG